MPQGLVRIRRALLSVSDKSGLLELAQALQARGVELLSTGGTAQQLGAAGVPVTEVSAYTGFPEIMDGRVKTLHPRIHGGLLGRRGSDEAVMRELGIAAIDLLVVNLYPFAETIARADCTREQAIENIDVGGPAMLRAAAKNHESVLVLTDPQDYGALLGELDAHGGAVSARLRARCAAQAFAHTAQYDARVAAYLAGPGALLDGDAAESHGARASAELLPPTLVHAYERIQMLRYGENPHQHAAFYRDAGVRGPCVARARLLQGKELSLNNVADADTAIECVRQFDEPACVIVKHANPCGVALGASPLEAYERAHRTDPTSAFGGIIAFNRELDAAAAEAILSRQFVEVLCAPSFEPRAHAQLGRKANVRVLELGDLAAPSGAALELRSVTGGLLAQSRDEGRVTAALLRSVTRRAPTAAEVADLLFAWSVCKFVKSNAIVFARDRGTVGIGAGQTSRVHSTRIAAMKAADEKLEVRGAVMASDAFFPFRDGLDAAAELGIVAAIQPGGSMRDAEVIAAADEHGIAMVFTGMRHFRH